MYANEKNILYILSLLKAHGVKKIIASPGSANHTMIASMQHDADFEMFSCVDERSAAYMACGLAAESKKPVAIVCTGATASRNYMPALTEAFYRKLPVIAITASSGDFKIGHHLPQCIDRSVIPNDIVNCSIHVPTLKDKNEEWKAVIDINKALLALHHRGGGPIHINFETSYTSDYSVKTLPQVRKISRHTTIDHFPDLPVCRIGIFVGAHSLFSQEQTEAIDRFCDNHAAVVFCDHTSNYYGRYRVNFSLVCSQEEYLSPLKSVDLLIHIGEVSGDYFSMGISRNRVWRVSEDGELRDTFHALTDVFEMPEKTFFEYYWDKSINPAETLLGQYKAECQKVEELIPEIPLSNVWVAQQLGPNMPKSVLHFGILNSLRAWNYFEMPRCISASSNVGGFGIDGCMSTMIGASLANPEIIHYGIYGDLAFFYDMNSLGIRHIGNNVRILLINNGKGNEFRLYWQQAARFGEETDQYIAAAGHYGNKSQLLVKHIAEDLGFQYLSAKTKEEFMNCAKDFTNPEISSGPILLEVFTTTEDENDAVYKSRHLLRDAGYASRLIKNKVKSIIK